MQFSNCTGKWGTANSMPLIRACWHFNCWRFILNLQNLNLPVWKVEALFHFLWPGIPQSLAHNHRGSYIRWAWIPTSSVNPTRRDESVIQPLPPEGTQFPQEFKGNTQYFKSYCRHSHWIPASPLHNSTILYFFCLFVCLLWNLHIRQTCSSLSHTLKQKANKQTQQISHTQRSQFLWSYSFESYVVTVWDSSFNFFFSPSDSTVYTEMPLNKIYQASSLLPVWNSH